MGAEHSTLAALDADEPVALTHLNATAELDDDRPSWSHRHAHRNLRPGGPFKARTIFGAKQHVVLHHAVQERNLASVRHLLEYLDAWTSSQPGPDALNAAQSLVNSFDSHHMTPLMLACQQGASEATRLLLEHGADPLLADRAGNNSLHLAARAGHVGCIQHLLTWQDNHQQDQQQQHSSPRLVDSRNGCGYVPLHYAVWARCREGAELLLSAGASLTARNTIQGWDLISAGTGNTPLHLAAHRGSTSMSKTLLSAYLSRGDRSRRVPDPRRLPNGDGRVPYEVALQRGRTAVLPVLDPTAEWQQIFGEGADVAHLFSPATLAEMAAAQLRWKLLGELEQIESASTQPPTPRLTRTLSIPLHRHPSGRLPAPLSDPCCDPSTTPPATPDSHTAYTHYGPFSTPRHACPLRDSLQPSTSQCSGSCSHAPCPCGRSSSRCPTSCSPPSPSLLASGLPQHCTEEASCSSPCSSSAASSFWAAAAVEQAQQECDACSSSSSQEEEEEEPCGICLEAGEQLVHMQPCRHFTCAACMKQLLNTVKLGAAPTCPFCRGVIGGLQ